MDATLDNTTLSTLSLLEARLLRIEHLLYGPAGAPSVSPSSHEESVAETLEALERRFYALLGRIKVYGELMKIYKSHPTLFHPPPPDKPPIDLPAEAISATVIASAPTFPAIASSLTSVSDCPIPDPAQSAALASLIPRMRGLEATQRAQAAEMAELRARSEAVIQHWYENGVLAASRFVADAESRTEKAERRVRRAEREKEREAEGVL